MFVLLLSRPGSKEMFKVSLYIICHHVKYFWFAINGSNQGRVRDI